jgi:hypothetical protein
VRGRLSGFTGAAGPRRLRRSVLLIASPVLARAACYPTPAPPPPGGTFVDEVVFSALTEPTALRFAPDGRVLVAEKSGLIKVFHNLADTTLTVLADLRAQCTTSGTVGPSASPSIHSSPRIPGCTFLHA